MKPANESRTTPKPETPEKKTPDAPKSDNPIGPDGEYTGHE